MNDPFENAMKAIGKVREVDPQTDFVKAYLDSIKESLDRVNRYNSEYIDINLLQEVDKAVFNLAESAKNNSNL